MDIEDRIFKSIEEYAMERGKHPNKLYISRDLCGELGINITVNDRELICDEWIFNLKVVPTWFNNTIFVTYDEKLNNKNALIDKLMAIDIEVEFKDGVLTPRKISEELSDQMDEDLKYLHNYIAFEEYYDEWCKKKNIEN